MKAITTNEFARLSGTYRADPVHSSFAFAVRHSGVYRYRASIAATLDQVVLIRPPSMM
jgi:polyisoprenoid-binding protein YceI